MHNITLISSKHNQLGACNSLALCEILKSINPEVIFEELPRSYFHFYYGQNSTKSTLETISIADFIRNKNIRQVLVDTVDFPHLEALKNNYSIVLDHCLNFRQQNGLPIKEAIFKSNQLIYEKGFDYLNSKPAETYQANIRALIGDCLVQINSKLFCETLKQWQSLTDFREDHMIESIYRFSEVNEFTQAVFTLGVAHRNSIRDKIEMYEQHSAIKLKWKFYGE